MAVCPVSIPPQVLGNFLRIISYTPVIPFPLDVPQGQKRQENPGYKRALNYSESTLMGNHTSVDSKPLTESLNPLNATLTKNQGEGAVIVN